MKFDLRRDKNQIIKHCNNCERNLDCLLKYGLLNTSQLAHHCLYQADSVKTYLIQCIDEALKERVQGYIKPTIITDGMYDYYNKKFQGSSNYNLTDFITCDETDVLLVYGEGGIGKSCFLNQLYTEIAFYSLKNNFSIIPIYIKAEDYGRDETLPDSWIKNKLFERYRYINFDPAFHNQDIQVVFFIDAINDIQYTDYNDFLIKLSLWSSYIQSCFNIYTNIKYVISSRHLDSLSNFEIRNYKKLYIQPLDDDQVKCFIQAKGFTKEKTKQIIDIVSNHIDLPFLRIPFFLNRVILAHIDKIKNKTSVIDIFIDSLIQNNNSFINNSRIQISHFDRNYKDIDFGNITFLEALSTLAFINLSNNKTDISKEDIKNLLKANTHQFLDIVTNNSLLTKNGSKFSHPIFQEYFTGKYIYSQLQSSYTIDDLFPFSDEMRLVQALKHVYNFLDDKEYFINLLIKNNKLIIAAECLVDEKNDKLKSLVSKKIISVLEHNESIVDTSNLGFLLGKIGDSRITQNTKSDFCEPIPVSLKNWNLTVGKYPITNLEYSMFIRDGGYDKKEYWIGSEMEVWSNFDTRIKAICSFWNNIQNKLNRINSIFEFCMKHEFDKIFIANLIYFKTIEYEELLEIIKDLYSIEKTSKPLMWENPTYNNPSQPVVGISIYEAMAYCKWLRKKTGKPYRLLNEDEWNTVAYSDRKKYSYGNHFRKLYSNTSESQLKKIIPVGLCGKNCTSDGVYDLTGNIFEWTSSEYKNPNSMDDSVFKQYVCKGGSWIQDANRAKSRYTGRGMGWVRNLDIGFRVCYNEL